MKPPTQLLLAARLLLLLLLLAAGLTFSQVQQCVAVCHCLSACYLRVQGSLVF